MADNVTITQGSGTSIATEDVSGVQHQKIKIEFGDDGTATMVSSRDPLPVENPLASTGTTSQISDTNLATTILAANSSRLGATIYNDSSALLYLLFGAGTVSSTNYSVRVYSNGFVDCPLNYIGIISGIWATDPNDGAARITEFTS